ncbi:phospholipase D family protein [Pseudomonas fluorescens]|uniref:phospholipase D family protein n=1 Tax=Pseudomonas fluorescens TaxID=294 RepID=UPI0030D80D6D
MELLNQPFTGQLGDRLIESLNSPDFHTLNIVVAFAKNSGVLRIKDALAKFRERGGKVNAYVGVDLGGTSYEALAALLLNTDSLNVVHSEKAQTFHAKIYQFLGVEKGLMVVGSHNLTGGGLWTNFESSVIIKVDRSSVEEMRILRGMDDYIGKLTSLKDSLMSISAQDDIDTLLQNGYVFKEIAEQVRLAKAAKQQGTGKRLFGYGVTAKLPAVFMPKKKKTAAVSVTQVSTVVTPQDSRWQTIWFETKKLTGGSRNILDLSMKSLVERGDPIGTPFDLREPGFMRGGVGFFGLDPIDTGKTKNIILNFEGVDYTGNTILYPAGGKANGTWRLQIKGISSSGVKITDAFRAKGEENYLVEKVITFNKIEDDYYSISVSPESELDNFQEASRILARNGSGRNSKRLGLL